LREGKGARDRPSNENDLDSLWVHVLTTTVRFADPASGSVALDGPADPTTHRECYFTRRTASLPQQQKAAPLVSMAPLKQRLDVLRAPESLVPAEGQCAARPPHAWG
jgi:hypothetical protein